MFLEQPISILECFLKDHVFNNVHNSALHHRNNLHFKIC